MVQDEQEATYQAMLELYDLAEKLLDTVEESTDDPATQLQLLEPLINQLEESANTLTEEYAELVKEKKLFDQHVRKKIETALRKVFLALEECKKRIETMEK